MQRVNLILIDDFQLHRMTFWSRFSLKPRVPIDEQKETDQGKLIMNDAVIRWGKL